MISQGTLLLAPEGATDRGLWCVYKVTKREVWMLQLVGPMVINAKLKGMEVPDGWREVDARETAALLYEKERVAS